MTTMYMTTTFNCKKQNKKKTSTYIHCFASKKIKSIMNIQFCNSFMYCITICKPENKSNKYLPQKSTLFLERVLNSNLKKRILKNPAALALRPSLPPMTLQCLLRKQNSSAGNSLIGYCIEMAANSKWCSVLYPC